MYKPLEIPYPDLSEFCRIDHKARGISDMVIAGSGGVGAVLISHGVVTVIAVIHHYAGGETGFGIKRLTH